MELRLLRYFVAVAEELHFARAAERLRIEQSPLSRAIRDLEDQLGIQLFERTSRSTRLTSAGIVFLEKSRRVLASVDDAVDAAQSAARGFSGSLRLGVSDSQAHPYLVSLLSRSRQEQPDVNIRVFDMPISQQIRGIQQDLLDGGIAFSNNVGSGVVAEPIWSEPLSIVTPSNHPILRRESVALEDVVRYPLVLCHREAGNGCHDRLMQQRRDAHPPIQIVEYAKSIGVMLTLVGAGYGIGFALASHVQTLTGVEIQTRPFTGKAPMLTMYLLRRAGVATEPMARFTMRALEHSSRYAARAYPASGSPGRAP